jgi:S1-C subfamily serine protease
MSASVTTPVTSVSVDADDGIEEEGPNFPWLPPDDRLWRHPSELQTNPMPIVPATATRTSEHRMWTVALLAGMVGALLASGVGVAAGTFHHSTTVVRPVERVLDTSIDPQFTQVAAIPKQSDLVVSIADALRPMIVELLINGNTGPANGSGVVFRSDGYVLTNNHVVAGATLVTAVLANGRQVPAKVVGGDPETDIAVVKIAVTNQQPVATLEPRPVPRVGQMAVAIGSPVNMAAQPSISVGVVSAVGQDVSLSQGAQLIDMIQTDARIAPAASGGALVDSSAAVIGITTAVTPTNSSTSAGGFAVPIETATSVASQLIATGRVTHGWLGVGGKDLDVDSANQLKVMGGGMVTQVDPGSPAAKAGLVAGDVITQLDGRPVVSMDSVVVALRTHKPGDQIDLSFVRDGKPHRVKVVVTVRPETP